MQIAEEIATSRSNNTEEGEFLITISRPNIGITVSQLTYWKDRIAHRLIFSMTN